MCIASVRRRVDVVKRQKLDSGVSRSGGTPGLDELCDVFQLANRHW